MFVCTELGGELMRRRLLMDIVIEKEEMKNMKLIKTIICNGNDMTWNINLDDDGNAFSCTEIVISLSKASYSSYTGIGFNGIAWSSDKAIKIWYGDSGKDGCIWIECVGGGIVRYIANLGAVTSMRLNRYALNDSDEINQIQFRLPGAPAEGETIEIYGR